MHAFTQLYKYVSRIYTYLLSHDLIGSVILFQACENFDKIVQTLSCRDSIYAYKDYFLWHFYWTIPLK